MRKFESKVTAIFFIFICLSLLYCELEISDEQRYPNAMLNSHVMLIYVSLISILLLSSHLCPGNVRNLDSVGLFGQILKSFLLAFIPTSYSVLKTCRKNTACYKSYIMLMVQTMQFILKSSQFYLLLGLNIRLKILFLNTFWQCCSLKVSYIDILEQTGLLF